MATIVELTDLPSPKRAGELVRIIDELHRAGRNVVVWIVDDGLRQVLDTYLWTFSDTSFVPHISWGPELGEVVDPVVLVGEAANPNRSEDLVVGDGLPPADWARTFAVVHDVIPPGEEGDERRAWWDDWKARGGER